MDKAILKIWESECDYCICEEFTTQLMLNMDEDGEEEEDDDCEEEDSVAANENMNEYENVHAVGCCSRSGCVGGCCCCCAIIGAGVDVPDGPGCSAGGPATGDMDNEIYRSNSNLNNIVEDAKSDYTYISKKTGSRIKPFRVASNRVPRDESFNRLIRRLKKRTSNQHFKNYVDGGGVRKRRKRKRSKTSSSSNSNSTKVSYTKSSVTSTRCRKKKGKSMNKVNNKKRLRMRRTKSQRPVAGNKNTRGVKKTNSVATDHKTLSGLLTAVKQFLLRTQKKKSSK